MKVLAITGKIAEEIVKKSVKELRNVEVQILPISVAAFMTPEFIIKNLHSLDSKYDMILLPGSIQGDVSSVEEKFGIPTYKGTTHAADIALCFEEGVELSKIQSATEIYKSKIQKRAFEKINFIKKNRKKILNEYGGFLLGSAKREVPIGSHFPMPVIAEIVNAPIRTSEEVAQISKYYQKEGAEIIDIGMIAGRPLPEKIPKIIETIHSSVELPISIDTLNEDEIISAVKSEVDLVLSIDSGNMDNLAEICRDIPVVVLPSNIRKGWLPREAEERVRSLNNNLENAKKLGYSKLIADPVLEPAFNPGLMNSLKAYSLFRLKDKSTPTLFGLGNVSELIDVDSVGVNGLLTALAYELEANLLFTPEYSNKTKGSVRELATSSKMMFLAKSENKTPKDIGIDLLVLKEKRWVEQPIEKKGEKIFIHHGVKDSDYKPDSKGWFKIQINREENVIEAIKFNYDDTEPKVIISGVEATEIYQTIIRQELVQKLDHAAYLGRELAKAEIALKLNRSYVQDELLF